LLLILLYDSDLQAGESWSSTLLRSSRMPVLPEDFNLYTTAPGPKRRKLTKKELEQVFAKVPPGGVFGYDSNGNQVYNEAEDLPVASSSTGSSDKDSSTRGDKGVSLSYQSFCKTPFDFFFESESS